jgi:quercetin dioxygenase-like cupin family protein
MIITRMAQADRYEPEKDWQRRSLCSQEDISIEHFTKPARHASPHHAHPSAQVLVVLTGKIMIYTENDGEVLLEEGDTAYIPGDEAHTVANALNEPSSGLDIFIPGRSFDFWLKRKK